MIRRTGLIYGILAAVWGLIVAWQSVEHNRVKNSERTALINRSRDITTTLSVVIRSQRFRGLIFQERLERALKDLVKSGELSSVAMLNASGDVVASAGPPIDRTRMQTGEHWEEMRVTVGNLVDLGVGEATEGETNRTTIVLPPRPPGASRERPRPAEEGVTNSLNISPTNTPGVIATNSAISGPTDPPAGTAPGTNQSIRGSAATPGERRPGWRRPPWMDEKEYKSLLETRGLHGVVIAMSTANFRRACDQDLWMRLIIGCFASVSVSGLGLAWRNLAKSSELQMRLLRASEMNSHLKEMNLAAAGLAHETRNPLNIIRGQAQLISKQEDASPEIRRKLSEIIDGTDRVTAQLNEFINYSRPREVRRSAVALSAAVGEVVRALNYDIEEKSIRLETSGDQVTVEADEQLLRQLLFNLLLNAIQAVEPKGEIHIIAHNHGASVGSLEVLDNGPGVPDHQRLEIFKPYFTTHEKGTGLGLAVVQQIVLAHGWEIECLPNQPKGANFRITHLKLTNGS